MTRELVAGRGPAPNALWHKPVFRQHHIRAAQYRIKRPPRVRNGENYKMPAMKTLTQEQVDKALKSHETWLRNERWFFGLFRAGKQADFRGKDLSFRVLSYKDLRQVIFSDGNRCANLSQAYLIESTLDNCDLRNVNLTMAQLNEAHMHGAVLDGADLSNTFANQANMVGCSLKQAKLHQTDMHRANLQGADFTNTTLDSTRLADTCLVEARLQGVTAMFGDFSGANLLGADLTNASFEGTDMRSANFKEALLDHSTFTGAALDRAIFTPAMKDKATFNNCKSFGWQNADRPRPLPSDPSEDMKRKTERIRDINRWDKTNVVFDIFRPRYRYSQPNVAPVPTDSEQVGKSAFQRFKQSLSKKVSQARGRESELCL